MDEVETRRKRVTHEERDWLSALMEKDRLSHTSRLIRGLIHNINGSLHNLSMLSEMLLQGQAQLDALLTEPDNLPASDSAAVRTKLKDRLQKMMQQVAMASEMLQDFSVVHEMLGGSTEVDITFALEKLVKAFRSDLFFKHRVDVTLQLQEDLPPVPIPGRALVPVLMHLVRNALLALSVAEEKRLGIECSRCGEQVRIVIRDTGIGFGPSEQEHLTDLFFTGWSREIREKDDQESHHGLGLYAASALLEPYGARFSLTREGAETVAIVEIPLGEQA